MTSPSPITLHTSRWTFHYSPSTRSCHHPFLYIVRLFFFFSLAHTNRTTTTTATSSVFVCLFLFFFVFFFFLFFFFFFRRVKIFQSYGDCSVPRRPSFSQLVSSQFSLIEDDGGLAQRGGFFRDQRRSHITHTEHIISLSPLPKHWTSNISPFP